MATLTPLSADLEASWHTVRDEPLEGVTRYVVSTPESRRICNRPEVVGHEYTRRLGRAVAAALLSAPFRSHLERVAESEICVFHFLRGGLNFGLREAVHEALGFTRHGSAFLSSQRRREDDGRWRVTEDQYRKLDVPSGAVLLVGDVVATGTTVAHGLETLLEALPRRGGGVRRIVFFTVGSAHLERVLADFTPRLLAAYPRYEGATAVYLEGRFALVEDPGAFRIAVPGTDLVRRGALLAPQFVQSQREQVAYPLERCAIYDAGARAFDVPTYVEDVAGYWEGVRALAKEGLTLREALAERWEEAHPETGEGDAAALLALCEGRLETLRALLR